MNSILTKIRIRYKEGGDLYADTTNHDDLKTIANSSDPETLIEVGSIIHHNDKKLKVVGIETIVSQEEHRLSKIGGTDTITYENGIRVSNDGSYNFTIYYIVEDL